MELSKGFEIFILLCVVHLTTNEISHLPAWSDDGTFYDVENQESKVVFIKTSRGGMFMFFESMNTSSLVYQVTFGSFGIRTVIRGQHKDGPKSITIDPALLPEESRYKPFYFQWENNMMVVGAGTVVGQGPRFQLSYNVNVTVRYMFVRTITSSMDYILDLSCRKG
ncbi:hypothetical protein SNE40_000601 [Patella caerulea]|uniref:Farnesoic acid O-methyl transferase domain-containing protein n=1 Tax=Patella caerulea TaxID=87958 RepID=A0AAN8KCJ9_PATCE